MRSKYWFATGMLICSVLMFAQARKDAPDTIAGIQVNYDEARVGDYVLPDALTLNDGKPNQLDRSSGEQRQSRNLQDNLSDMVTRLHALVRFGNIHQ
jgi:hypothetical protein